MTNDPLYTTDVIADDPILKAGYGFFEPLTRGDVDAAVKWCADDFGVHEGSAARVFASVQPPRFQLYDDRYDTHDFRVQAYAAPGDLHGLRGIVTGPDGHGTMIFEELFYLTDEGQGPRLRGNQSYYDIFGKLVFTDGVISRVIGIRGYGGHDVARLFFPDDQVIVHDLAEGAGFGRDRIYNCAITIKGDDFKTRYIRVKIADPKHGIETRYLLLRGLDHPWRHDLKNPEIHGHDVHIDARVGRIFSVEAIFADGSAEQREFPTSPIISFNRPAVKAIVTHDGCADNWIVTPQTD